MAASACIAVLSYFYTFFCLYNVSISKNAFFCERRKQKNIKLTSVDDRTNTSIIWVQITECLRDMDRIVNSVSETMSLRHWIKVLLLNLPKSWGNLWEIWVRIPSLQADFRTQDCSSTKLECQPLYLLHWSIIIVMPMLATLNQAVIAWSSVIVKICIHQLLYSKYNYKSTFTVIDSTNVDPVSRFDTI
jgi:hypothetical protein